MKFNKQEGPREAASIPLRRRNKIITGIILLISTGRGREVPGSERLEGGER